MGTVGATFLLIGIGFLYMMTGTLNMADLAERIPEVRDTRTVRAALAFIIVGMGLKLALLPLHLWLPNAYTYAPSFVTVFWPARPPRSRCTSCCASCSPCSRRTTASSCCRWPLVLMVLAIAGMFAGSWVAMFQANLKRMLAYSSVAQVGYMVLGISLVSLTGMTATLFFTCSITP
jgi:multicomponent Na+:H+ antiporter subunit D